MKKRLGMLCAASALALAGQASAATTWTLNTNPQTIDGITMTRTGWANTGSGGSIATQALQQQTSLNWYSGGLGITNLDACGSNPCDSSEGSSPEHAIDNNGRYEMLLLSFSQTVQLDSVKLGWMSTDSDITVMAYNGAGSGASSLNGNTWAGVSSAWTSIGNYSNVGTAAPKAVNAGGVSSSYWLIGAYNPLAGGGSLSAGNDYIKMMSVTTTPGNQVPEPGTLALLGLGLLGVLARQKRQTA